MEACVIFTPCLDVDVNCLLISSWRQQPRGVDTQQFSFFVTHEQVVINDRRRRDAENIPELIPTPRSYKPERGGNICFLKLDGLTL